MPATRLGARHTELGTQGDVLSRLKYSEEMMPVGYIGDTGLSLFPAEASKGFGERVSIFSEGHPGEKRQGVPWYKELGID